MYPGLCKGHDDRPARASASLKEALRHLLTFKGIKWKQEKTEGNVQYSLHLALCSGGTEDAFTEVRDTAERGRQCWEKEGATDALLNCPKCLLLDTVYPPGFKKIGQTKSRI